MRYPKIKISPEIKELFNLFIIWRLLLYLFLLIGFLGVPVAGRNFFGGGFELYNQYFFILPWANFDGEHYMSIAMDGYKSLEQAFFPLYPLLIHIGSWLFPRGFVTSASVGFFLANLALLGSMGLLYKLVRLDYSSKVAWWAVVLLLTFPTSFYFGAVYTESLFLLLSLGAFYFARKEKWWLATLCGFLASLTRVFGVLLLPALLIEMWQMKKPILKWYPILLIPLGLLLYMTYSWITIGDPLAFYHLQSLIGEHRGKGIILFPQVVYRYLNILIHYQKLDTFLLTFLLEFLSTVLFFVLPFVGYFKKVRWSYLFYALVSLLLPTIQGSFSSGSRYVLVIFPGFIIMALLIEKLPRPVGAIINLASVILLGVFTALFVRGYWVA